MADYTPVWLPGLTGTFTAAGAITGGDPVEVAGSGTVQKVAGLASAKYVGVAGADAKTGEPVTVIMARVVHEGLADGAVNAGDQLTASPVAGRQVAALPAATGATAGDINAARAVVGIALTTAASGTVVRWQQV